MKNWFHGIMGAFRIEEDKRRDMQRLLKLRKLLLRHTERLEHGVDDDPLLPSVGHRRRATRPREHGALPVFEFETRIGGRKTRHRPRSWKRSRPPRRFASGARYGEQRRRAQYLGIMHKKQPEQQVCSAASSGDSIIEH